LGPSAVFLGPSAAPFLGPSAGLWAWYRRLTSFLVKPRSFSALWKSFHSPWAAALRAAAGMSEAPVGRGAGGLAAAGVAGALAEVADAAPPWYELWIWAGVMPLPAQAFWWAFQEVVAAPEDPAGALAEVADDAPPWYELWIWAGVMPLPAQAFWWAFQAEVELELPDLAAPDPLDFPPPPPRLELERAAPPPPRLPERAPPPDPFGIVDCSHKR